MEPVVGKCADVVGWVVSLLFFFLFFLFFLFCLPFVSFISLTSFTSFTSFFVFNSFTFISCSLSSFFLIGSKSSFEKLPKLKSTKIAGLCVALIQTKQTQRTMSKNVLYKRTKTSGKRHLLVLLLVLLPSHFSQPFEHSPQQKQGTLFCVWVLLVGGHLWRRSEWWRRRRILLLSFWMFDYFSNLILCLVL